MLNFAIAHSEDIDSSDAIDEILEQCSAQLEGKVAQAGMLYAAIDHEFDILLQKINNAYPNIELIGCTTDGEISSSIGFAEDSSLLILFESDDIDIKAGLSDNLSEGMDRSISEALNQTKSLSDKEARLCIVNPASININGELVLNEFRKNLGDTFPIFGGSAADQWQFNQTYQFYKNGIYKNSCPFLIFSGPLVFSFGVSSGWEPLGQPGIVSSVEGNVLYQVDDKKAVDYYKYYLGENITPLGEYPLAVFTGDDDFYLRAPLAINEDDGSLVFAGDISKNAKVQITHARRKDVLNTCHQTIIDAFAEYPGKDPLVMLCFSCSGRKQVLGTQVSEEFAIIKEQNPEIPVFGFYGYGEICPLKTGQPSLFHNETFVSLLLGSE